MDRPVGHLRSLDSFPRIIHLFWDKGEEPAPELVRVCLQSWRIHNPGWHVRFWTERTAPLDRARFPSDMKTAAYSDMLRLHLLKEQGGVWCDATTLCTRPLDQWLLQIMSQTDFFAFSRPGPDRAISSWFLASRCGTSIVDDLWRECIAFWKGRKAATRSYFWFHYMFEYLERTSPRFRREWQTAPKLSAVPLFSLSLVKDLMQIPEHQLALYRSVPLHKLTYKRDLDIHEIMRILS